MAELTGEYLQHRVVDGEYWDTIAWNYYAAAGRYHEILRANPGLRDGLGQWPDAPPVGIVVLVPVLNRRDVSPPVEALPPWLR